MEHESLNISMPKQMHRYVRNRIARGGFGNVSEYFRDLVRRERESLTQSEIESRLLRSLSEGEERPLTTDTFAEIRNSVRNAMKSPS